MIRQSTIELLKEMRFSAMASELERQLADEETYREMSFEDRLAMLSAVAKNRNCLKKGNELDYAKASNILLEEFRNGKIGRITLEQA